ncbi:Cof-type HAD-IIB family hydrolase [Paenibacillus sp. PK3_47]|uniref:Cof-type HAD-IIB family hydrolase n=1 Tax=Paenibacillus sp. PK3_47 TaxID=2072642 RepID=UPI00201DFE57|nr:Cof-type HAD-IIB family hydrolase [Paenibacillus sp. PK3_47]UQZ36092.1 Cof-type HAD-IIB family hydrolase [Paenibacillus sp. PK3_47]
MKYKLIALDVDGTLLHDDHSLSDENKQAVAEVTRMGGQIVLCTGRSPQNSIPFMLEMGLSGYVLGHNGAATVRVEDRKIMHQYGMDARGLDPYIDYCRERNIHFDVSTAFDMYVDNVENLTQEANYMYEHFKIIPAALPAWEDFREPVVKFTVFTQREKLDEAQREWGTWTQQYNMLRSGEFFIDFMHPESSKGNALKNLAAELGIAQEEVLSIGNYYNDISMLTYAGMGVAMDNSPLEVKAAANAVTGTNNENGVRDALVKYCLS